MKQHLKILIFDRERGEIVCGCGCGRVVESNTIDLSQPDQINNDHGTSFVHHQRENKQQHDFGLGTVLSTTDFRNKKTVVPVEKLNRYNFQLKQDNPESRRLIRYFQVVQMIKNQLPLTNGIIEEIAYFIRKASSKKILKGKNSTIIILAIAYLVAKNHDIHLTKNDIQKIKPINSNTFNRTCFSLKETLEIEFSFLQSGKQFHLNRVLEQFDANLKTRTVCTSIVNYCNEKNLIPGHKPQAVAAAIFYVVQNKYGFCNISIADIATFCKISYATLTQTKKNMKDIFEIFELDIELKKSIALYRELVN